MPISPLNNAAYVVMKEKSGVVVLLVGTGEGHLQVDG